MKKKIFALILCLAMMFSLAACGGDSNKPTDDQQTPPPAEEQTGPAPQPEEQQPTEPVPSDKSPAEQIVNSYYSYYYYPSTDFLMDYFFHFYDEVPGIGQVYYAGFALNQIVYSGTYEVVEEPHDYACWSTREEQEGAGEGAAAPTGTAPYTVNFYDFDGNLVDSCGFDGQNLYMDMENINGVGAEANVFTLDADPENSVLAADYANEQAPSLVSLVAPDDETATLELLINGRYKDMVIFAVDGTYAANDDLTEFTLTPNNTGDNGATVTKNEDGTYTYKSDDGTEVSLAAASNVETVYTYKGLVPVPGTDGEGDLIAELKSDNTVRLYASAFGSEMDLDAGTYAIDMTTYSIIITFDHAGEITTYTDEAGMHFDYAATGLEVFGDVQTTLDMLAE